MTFMKDKLLEILTNALLGILVWLCTSTATKMNSIQKDITDLRVEITRINSTIITRDDVKVIVIDELEKRGL